MKNWQLSEYLNRIGHKGPINVSEETLKSIHTKHLEAIPFENLEAISGHTPSLDFESIFSKLVFKKRGGWCFEQNELFLNALKAIGFYCHPSMSRVFFRGNEWGIRTHYIGQVELEEKTWLTDVGFGVLSPKTPLIVDSEREVIQGNLVYQVSQKGPFGKILRCKIDGIWHDLYGLNLEEVLPSDLAISNFWVSNSKDCVFSQIPIVEIKQKEKEFKVIGDHFIYSDGKTTRKNSIKSVKELDEIFRSHFKINLAQKDLNKVFHNSHHKFSLPHREWSWGGLPHPVTPDTNKRTVL